MFNRIKLAANLDRSDAFTARALARWTEELATTLDTEEASELTPLFGQLFAVKDLRAMYVERQNSLKQQAECADHAARHLDRTIATMASYLDIEVDPTWQANLGIMDLVTPPPTVEQRLGLSAPPPPPPVGGATGVVQRLSMRFSAQMKACNEESFRAKAFLKEIDGGGGPSRLIEVGMVAKEAALKQMIEEVVERLEKKSFDVLKRERAESDELEAIA